jgi:FlaA1/EpsC-like NDP-sugar epimerase
MTRYFMTIPEATRLVLLTATLPETGGRVAMLEMGAPVRILELAENLIRLSGFEPHRDVPIVFTGVRPGEKLHEQLLSEVERTLPTLIDKIRIVETAPGDGELVEGALARLLSGLGSHAHADLRAAALMLVPECVDPLRSMLREPPRPAATQPRPSLPTHAVGR